MFVRLHLTHILFLWPCRVLAQSCTTARPCTFIISQGFLSSCFLPSLRKSSKLQNPSLQLGGYTGTSLTVYGKTREGGGPAKDI